MENPNKRPPSRAGRPSREAIHHRIREAIRFLDDPIALEESPLTSLPAVRTLTVSTFQGRTCAAGLALRALLRESLATVAHDLDGTLVADLAQAALRGDTQASVATRRGLREEWVSRRWKPVLVDLVFERISAAGEEVSRKRAA